MTPYRSRKLGLATWLIGQPHKRDYLVSKTLIYLTLLTLVLLWIIALPKIAHAGYPQIGVSGYKKWIYNDVNVQPQANYFSYVSSGEVFNRSAGVPWSEPLRLQFSGQLNEDLNLGYRIEQYPKEEDRQNFRINYKKYTLGIGNINIFSDKTLIATDFINGAVLEGEFGNLKYKYLPLGNFPKLTLSGPFRDYKQYLSPKYFGPKNQTNYVQNDSYLELLGVEAGRSDVKTESVQVTLGGKTLFKDFDYFIDTEFGLFLFPSAFKVYKTGLITFESLAGERVEIPFNLETEAFRRAYYIPEFRVIDASESITIDGLKLKRGVDYRAYYNSGLFILNRPLNDDVDVRINYDFTYGPGVGGDQKVQGLALEYKLMDGHKVGISFFKINSSSSEVGSLATSSKSDNIFSITDKLDINSMTYILGEYAFSDSDYFTGYSAVATKEYGSAIGLSGRTRIGELRLSANYKYLDPAFASIRKIKNNENWKYEEKNLQGEYRFGDYLEVRGGTGSELSRRSTATQEGTTTTTLGISLNPGFSLLSFDADIYLKRPESGEEEISQLLTIRFKPPVKSPLANPLLKDWEAVAKNNNNSIGFSRKESTYQILSYLESNFGLSTNIGWKYAVASEDGLPSGTRFDGLLRVAYMFDFGQSHRLEIYSDYLDGLQKNSLIRGETQNIDAKIAEIGYGFLWRIPQANPIFLGLSFGGYYKIRNYKDSLNPADDYRASSLSFEGRFDF
jgi:hypothetical protein